MSGEDNNGHGHGHGHGNDHGNGHDNGHGGFKLEIGDVTFDFNAGDGGKGGDGGDGGDSEATSGDVSVHHIYIEKDMPHSGDIVFITYSGDANSEGGDGGVGGAGGAGGSNELNLLG